MAARAEHAERARVGPHRRAGTVQQEAKTKAQMASDEFDAVPLFDHGRVERRWLEETLTVELSTARKDAGEAGEGACIAMAAS